MNIKSSKQIIITAGEKWTDIDVLACSIGLKELFSLLKISSEVVLKGPFNNSITQYLRNLKLDLKTNFVSDPKQYSFAIVDISNPEYIASFVDKENIVILFDHHFGFEKYWKEIIKDNAYIDHVGACATLIWEKYEENGLVDSISRESAVLIAHAIISNTLNLQASVTTPRDIAVLKEIEQMKVLDQNYRNKYFEEISNVIIKNPLEVLSNDTYTLKIANINFVIGQMEVWNAKEVILENSTSFLKYLASFNVENSFLTIPSIEEGFNYIVTESEYIKSLLKRLIGVEFHGNIGKTSKLFMRKEIIRDLQNELN